MGGQDSDNIAIDVQDGHDIHIQNKERQKKHKCNYPDCNAAFLRPNKLERHIRLHTGERPYKCNHSGCTKSYTNVSHLKRHSETHNLVKEIYKCTECSSISNNFYNMKRHYKRMHGEKKISCRDCGETFNKKYHLVQHQAEQHSAPKIYKCDKCTKSFTAFYMFSRHRKLHEKRYSCSKCSEEFEKWLLLRSHIKAKHVTNYTCDTCGKVFFLKWKLWKHCKTHSENRLVLQCPYDNCYRVYYFKSNLDNHVRVCHLGKKFFCDICSMGFNSKKILTKHIQRHNKPKKKKRNKIQRKKRVDAGVSKKSVLSTLVGIKLPNNLEKMVMKRETKIKDTATIEAS